MSLSLRPAIVPRCSACIRSYAFSGGNELRPAQQQVRGKKKLANVPSTVTVRLLKSVKTFGRKGAIVPISIGQMRNEWFPRRIAEYVTYAQEKELKVKNTSMERDFAFGVDSSMREDRRPKEIVVEAPITRPVRVHNLSPERSAELLSILLPPRLEFYRQPIEQPPPEATPPPVEEPKRERQYALDGAAADLLAARTPQPSKPAPATAAKALHPKAIYGSVSTHDVLVAVRAALAENDEAARVVLAEEDVRFVETAEGETDRVKAIGDYNLELRVKGAEAAVRRLVRVTAQEG